MGILVLCFQLLNCTLVSFILHNVKALSSLGEYKCFEAASFHLFSLLQYIIVLAFLFYDSSYFIIC